MQTKTYLAILLAWLCLCYAQPPLTVEARPLGTDVSGTIDVDTTWTAAGSPYVLGNVTVAEGVTLRIMAGTVIKSNYGRLFIDGNLTVNGTADDKVVFTSYTDDTHGGDTNGDGDNTTPSGTQWYGISINSTGNADIEHTIIRYGGLDARLSRDDRAGLHILGGSLSFNNSTIEYSSAWGIYASGQENSSNTVTVDSSNFSNNNSDGLHSINNVVSIADSSFVENQANGVTIVNNQADSDRAISVTGSSFTANQSGGASIVIHSQSSEAPLIKDNTFSDNSYALNVSGLFSDKNVNNITTGDTPQQIQLSGKIEGNVVLPHGLYGISSVLAIPEEQSLTIESGSIIKSISGRLVVDGDLTVNGTADDKVVFTSLYDDTHGGDTNGDGDNTTPSSNQWYGITINSTGNADIEHTIIRYGGLDVRLSRDDRASLHILGGSLSLNNSTIEHSTRWPIYLDNPQPNTTIHNTIFGPTSNYNAIHNTTPDALIDARYNWWGDPSGPQHPELNPDGLGNSVSNGVIFDPWLLSSEAVSDVGEPVATRTPVPTSTPIPTHKIQGRVLLWDGNQNDQPANNVSVSIIRNGRQQTATTNGNGEYEATVESGTYLVSASKDNYLIFHKSTNVDDVDENVSEKEFDIKGDEILDDLIALPCKSPITKLNICQLQKGDILMEDSTSSFDNKAASVTSYFLHAALGDTDANIIEAAGYSEDSKKEVRKIGIQHTDFYSPTDGIEVTDWVVIRPKQPYQNLVDDAITYATEKAYDPNIVYLGDFLSENNKSREDAFYCSLLVWRAYKEQGLDLDYDRGVIGFVTTPFSSKLEAQVLPDDLYASTTYIDGVTDVVQTDSDVGSTARQIWSMWSPAEMRITDALGRQVGYDPETGNMTSDIPGAFYTEVGSEPKWIRAAVVEPVTVEVFGTGTGEYTLVANSLNDEITVDSVQGTTEVGQVDVYIVSDEPNQEVEIVPESNEQTATPTATSTPSSTPTYTLTPVPTPSSTPTPTNTFTPTSTPIPTSTFIPIPTNTATFIPTSTHTATSIPPTAIATAVPPTATPESLGGTGTDNGEKRLYLPLINR